MSGLGFESSADIGINLLRRVESHRNKVIMGAKTDIWRVDCIGQGTFKHAVRLIHSIGQTETYKYVRTGRWSGLDIVRGRDIRER